MPSTFKNGDRSDQAAVETGFVLALKFDERGLIPVITTDAVTGEVLMQAYMNIEAVTRTLETGEAYYYSRSRQSLWHKGATSGEIQTVMEMRVDCDQDSLWIRVHQQGGGCCHVGYQSCFFRSLPLKSDISEGKEVELTHIGVRKIDANENKNKA